MLSPVHARCEALLRAFEEKGNSVAHDLLPGLKAGELARTARWFSGNIPEELDSLYSWRNGQAGDPWLVKHVFWFRDMQFLTVERSEYEYESMMSSYGVDYDQDRDRVELRTCFPFAAFNGGWYVLPTAGHRFKTPHVRPVISVFQGIDIHFYSLLSMLDTCIAWTLAGEWSDGTANLSPEDEQGIWDRYNPGVFRPRAF